MYFIKNCLFLLLFVWLITVKSIVFAQNNQPVAILEFNKKTDYPKAMQKIVINIRNEFAKKNIILITKEDIINAKMKHLIGCVSPTCLKIIGNKFNLKWIITGSVFKSIKKNKLFYTVTIFNTKLGKSIKCNDCSGKIKVDSSLLKKNLISIISKYVKKYSIAPEVKDNIKAASLEVSNLKKNTKVESITVKEVEKVEKNKKIEENKEDTKKLVKADSEVNKENNQPVKTDNKLEAPIAILKEKSPADNHEEQYNKIDTPEHDSEKKSIKLTEDLVYYLPIDKTNKQTIAVLNFKINKGITEEMNNLLAEKIVMEVLVSKKFRVVDRLIMNKILKEHKFNPSKCGSLDCAVKIGKLFKVDKVIYGNINTTDDIYNVYSHIVDIKAAKIESMADFISMGDTVKLITKMESLSKKLLGIK